MAIEPVRKYTAEEFFRLDVPEGERYELWYGEIVALAAPGVVHQRVIRRLCDRMDRFIETHGGSCEPFQAPFDVVLEEGLVVQPDISLICDPEKLDGKRCNGAPDMVAEVVSGDRTRDLSTKLECYRTHGVREYWIIDPEYQRTIVYLFEGGRITAMDIYTFSQPIPLAVWDGSFEAVIGEMIT